MVKNKVKRDTAKLMGKVRNIEIIITEEVFKVNLLKEEEDVVEYTTEIKKNKPFYAMNIGESPLSRALDKIETYIWKASR